MRSTSGTLKALSCVGRASASKCFGDAFAQQPIVDREFVLRKNSDGRDEEHPVVRNLESCIGDAAVIEISPGRLHLVVPASKGDGVLALSNRGA